VIEKSSGQKTGDLYVNKPSVKDKNIILIKIHARNRIIARLKAWWLLPPFIFDEKYIYVYRDPRDSIISLYEMYRQKKNLYDLGPKEFLNIYDPIRQYRWEINSWVLQKSKNVLLVKYEDLKLFPQESFNRIFNYLGLNSPVVDKYIGEMVATSDLKNRPRGSAYGWKNAPAEYKCIINAVNNQLEREIKLLQYNLD
jgi:hypothetical protein